MEPQFEYYEQVRISSPDENHSQLVGRFGVILGRTQTAEDDCWYYTLTVDGEAECWCFFERQLEATGMFFTRDDFYDGSSIKVRVDEAARGFVDPSSIN